MMVIHVVCKDRPEADRIAQAILERRLAACVNMLPVESKYVWNDAIESASEVTMLIKTRKTMFARVSALVRSMHSYDVPAIFAFDVAKVDDDYARWLYGVVK
ncbi:MAG: divalent-cation tolerance protein CutA [Nanoarchaeota archaeon]